MGDVPCVGYTVETPKTGVSIVSRFDVESYVRERDRHRVKQDAGGNDLGHNDRIFVTKL